MNITTFETTNTPPAGNSYDDGYLDGELDAISKLPAHTAMNRAAMADMYDPLWAQGYADGFLHQIQFTYALAEKGRTI